MPAGESPRYRSEGARKTALLTKIRTLAPQRGLSPQALRREYVLQRFLALLFAAQPSPWVLKGGSGLLIRLPGARHSEDIGRANLPSSTSNRSGPPKRWPTPRTRRLCAEKARPSPASWPDEATPY
jgi:hypothetical protein